MITLSTFSSEKIRISITQLHIKDVNEMKKNNSSLALLLIFAATLFSVTVAASEKSVQHLQLPDVTSIEEAKQVFFDTTAELQAKNKLDADELHEIHIITYSLEKAVAYFAENSADEQQAAAKKMAELVELIHIGSENNRAAETGAHLKEYFKLADAFSKQL